MTPSDSVAIIAANAVEAIPYFSGGLKGVARFGSSSFIIYLNISSLFQLLNACELMDIARFHILVLVQEHAHISCS